MGGEARAGEGRGGEGRGGKGRREGKGGERGRVGGNLLQGVKWG